MDDFTDPRVEAHRRGVLAAYWALFPITVLMVGLRFYARITRAGLGFDDWTMFAAWVVYTTLVGLNTAMTNRGAFKHIETIPPADAIWISRVVYVSQFFASTAITLSRVAVGLLLLRLMKGKQHMWRRWVIYVHVALLLAIMVVMNITLFTQCDPPRALWNHELVVEGKATCPRVHVQLAIAMLQSAFGAYCDFVLALLPTTFILSLQMSTRRKVAICCLLGLGVLAGALGTARTLMFINAFDSTDPTFNSYRVIVLGILEIEVMIIAGSVAPAKPVFDRVFRLKPVEVTPKFQEPPRPVGGMKSSWLLSQSSSEKGSHFMWNVRSAQDSSRHSMGSQQELDPIPKDSIRVTKQVDVESE